MEKNFSKKLFDILDNYPSTQLMANVDTKVIKYNLNNEEIISTTQDNIKSNCYVASVYSLLVTYSKDELIKLDSFILRCIANTLIKIFGVILKLIKIDKIQILNNYMLSTNFFSKNFENIDLQKLKNVALKKYPNHTLIVRCVNKAQNSKLYENLKQNGWIGLVSRQVYIFDDFKACKKHQNYKWDKKLLDSKRYLFKDLDIENFSLFVKAEELYNQLYLNKYSKHNVQFKAVYLQELVKKELLHLRLLFDSVKNKYVAVVGLIGQDGVITAPIVGYDLNYDIKEALYRRVIAYIMEYSMQESYVLNLSSGASDFKLNRGAKANLEYMFVYVNHHSFLKKLVWKVLSFISNNFYGILLQRLKL